MEISNKQTYFILKTHGRAHSQAWVKFRV